MSRVLALIVVLAVIVPPTAGTWFKCRYDGRVRAACCCKHGLSPQSPSNARLEKADCCDVFVQARTAPAPATSDSGTLLIASVPLVLRPLGSAYEPPAVEARLLGDTRWPVFLRTRALLI